MKKVNSPLDSFQNKLISKNSKPLPRCTILMLFNLVKPFWMPVNCNEALIPNLVCSQIETQKEEKSLTGLPKRECKTFELLIQKDCFSFIYSDNVTNTEDVKTICQSNRGHLFDFNCPKELGNLKRKSWKHRSIFREIISKVMQPSNIAKFIILSATMKQTNGVTFTRVLYDIKPQCSQEQKGFFACVSKTTQLTVESENLIQQYDGEYISSSFICNVDFMIKNKNYNCHACLNSSSIHSHLYFKDKVGRCQSFLHETFSNIRKEMFISNANVIKSHKLTDKNNNLTAMSF